MKTMDVQFSAKNTHSCKLLLFFTIITIIISGNFEESIKIQLSLRKSIEMADILVMYGTCVIQYSLFFCSL